MDILAIESCVNQHEIGEEKISEVSLVKKAKGVSADVGSLAKCSRDVFFKVARKEGSGEVLEPFNNGISINRSEMQIIASIINYLDEKSTLALGLPKNQKYLKDQGKKIDHVHPLCFIWTIVSSKELKSKLLSFRDNSAFALKWNGFLGYSVFHDKGFGKNMERFYNSKQPSEYQEDLNAFYRVLGLKAEVMDPHAHAKNWKAFASALLDDSSYN